MKNTVFLAAAAFVASVVDVHGQSALNTFPSRVVGHREVTLRTTVPNIVEGRELNSPLGMALDRSSTPAGIYIADTLNNRVLGWRNAKSFPNGSPADVVIGQNDFISTGAGGPGTNRTIGLSSPIGLAVDSSGNLYVSDNGNNRILRYPNPFQSSDEVKVPDLVLGQPNFTSKDTNTNGISAATLALGRADSLGINALIFDGSGNLWVSDALNNRVLRYPASVLSAGRNGPNADLVIGQPGFDTNTVPITTDPVFTDRLQKNAVATPSGLAFDPAGRLYVTDARSRVLVFAPPATNGGTALRILGIAPAPASGQLPSREYLLNSPEGLAMLGNNLVVADRGNSRIVRYDAFETWAPEPALPAPAGSNPIISPPVKAVVGQFDLISFRPNRGVGEPTNISLALPIAVAVLDQEIFALDTGNHRLIVFPSLSSSSVATRVLGQDSFTANAVNQVDGRELYLFSSSGNLSGRDGAGVAIDNTVNPPHLYIADTFNNRILAYRDARRVRPGDRADLVIGQADFTKSTINSPQGLDDQPQDVGLNRPANVVVDSEGHLWVADSANGRVLRFGRPFAQQGRIRPNLVLGQQGLFQKLTDVSNRNMAYPFGLAFTAEGHVLVSDVAHNRVLLFRKPAGGDFTNFQAADRVIGQPDFFTSSRPNTAPNRLQQPRGIATDSDDRLYVADGLGRVVIYNRIVQAANDPAPALTLPANSPQGVYVNPSTGEIWVAEPAANRAIRYPRFDQLALNSNSDYSIPIAAPLGLTQDSSGNLYVAEGSNRIGIYFNGLALLNTANYHDRPVAPGMVTSIYPQSPTYLFGSETAAFSALPLPRTLAGIQVLVNESPAPLYFVSPGQINFLVPMSVPVGPEVEYQVVRESTGEILAVGQLQTASANPGLFVQGSALGGQLAALNQDNSVNSAQNPISRGSVIQLYATGQGFVPNAPPDGEAPAGPVPTPAIPRVIIGTAFVPDANIEYSGLAPGFPGVWQINVKVPDTVAPSNQTAVVVQLDSVNSNRTRGDRVITTTIAVKQ